MACVLQLTNEINLCLHALPNLNKYSPPGGEGLVYNSLIRCFLFNYFSLYITLLLCGNFLFEKYNT